MGKRSSSNKILNVKVFPEHDKSDESLDIFNSQNNQKRMNLEEGIISYLPMKEKIAEKFRKLKNINFGTKDVAYILNKIFQAFFIALAIGAILMHYIRVRDSSG